MTQPIKLCYRNILETSTVTVTTENASYPAYRLYDRDIGRLFKGDSTPANFYITLDQGGTISYEVDRLLIPAGHNLDGLALKLQYSADNFSSDNHDAASWTQSGSGLIDKAFTAQTEQYWRLNIAAPALAPSLAEIFLTKQYTFQRNPSWGFDEGTQKNIAREEALSGKVQKVKWGETRRHRRYDLTRVASAQKTDLENFDMGVDGMKSFYIEDTGGAVFFADMPAGLPLFKAEREGRWGITLDIIEIL
jgi:hypothetical protein